MTESAWLSCGEPPAERGFYWTRESPEHAKLFGRWAQTPAVVLWDSIEWHRAGNDYGTRPDEAAKFGLEYHPKRLEPPEAP